MNAVGNLYFKRRYIQWTIVLIAALYITLRVFNPVYVSLSSRSDFDSLPVSNVQVALGSYRFSSSTRGLKYKGNVSGEDFVAWVENTTYEYDRFRYFYTRSKSEDGFLVPYILPFTGEYNIQLVFGGAQWYEEGLTEEQKKDAVYLETVPSGRKVFNWGDGKSMYYHVGNRPIESVMTTPLPWHKLPMLEITKEQYQLLDKRCGWPWRNVRCFIDRDFPGLTPVQLEYVIAHEHEDDDDRLSGKVPMPEQPRSNPYK